MYKRKFLIEGENYIWIRVPKNGSTTIRNHLNTTTIPYKEKITNNKNKYVFIFSRNPFSRLVSCWVNRTKSGKKNYKGTGNWNNPQLLGLSFKEFVKKVGNIKDSKADHHFRSQTSFIQGLEIDFIGRVENLNEDLKNICKKLNLECQNKKKITHYKKSEHQPHRTYYDEETIKIVYERYKKDFELFGYTF